MLLSETKKKFQNQTCAYLQGYAFARASTWNSWHKMDKMVAQNWDWYKFYLSVMNSWRNVLKHPADVGRIHSMSTPIILTFNMWNGMLKIFGKIDLHIKLWQQTPFLHKIERETGWWFQNQEGAQQPEFLQVVLLAYLCCSCWWVHSIRCDQSLPVMRKLQCHHLQLILFSWFDRMLLSPAKKFAVLSKWHTC